MEPEGSLPDSQLPANCSHPELAQSTLCPTSHSLKIHINIIPPSTPGSSRCSLFLRFPNETLYTHLYSSHTCYMLSLSHSSRFDHLKKYLVRGTDHYAPSIHPSIHIWRYSPFRDLASFIRRLHSSLFPDLLHPLIPSSCKASLWTTSAHLVLGLPTGLVAWKFPFKTFFGILSSSILTMWLAHPNHLILMSSTMFGSLYKL